MTPGKMLAWVGPILLSISVIVGLSSRVFYGPDSAVEEIAEDEDPDAEDTLTFSYDDFETAKKED